MNKKAPFKTCNTQDVKCGTCSPCAKKMMILLGIVLLFGFFYVVSGAFSSKTTPAPEKSAQTAPPVNVQKSATSSILQPYSEQEFEDLQGQEKFALFFSAEWCPKCVATKKAIDQTPGKFKNVRLLDIDYDTATELKKEYGITLQHSLVFFEADGSLAGKATMPTDDEIIAFFDQDKLPSDDPEKTSKEDTNTKYQDYSQETYQNLLGQKPFALFFYADWCPTCRNQEKLITENLDRIPENMTILKANYDTQTDLKKQYSITMQSIIVVLDDSGQEIGRIGDFSSLEALTELFPNT